MHKLRIRTFEQIALVELRILDQEKPHYTGVPMHKLVEVYYYVDDFLIFLFDNGKVMLTVGILQRTDRMTMSEVMANIIL